MANMLRRVCNRGCCGNAAGGANPKPKEQREWVRDYEAGEYTNPVAQFRWDWKRIDLAEENEANLGFTGYVTASPCGDGDDF